MQAASVQQDMTNCKDELSHREAETAPLYRQRTEVMERNDHTEDEYFGLSGFVGRGFSGLEAGLDRTTTHQNNGKLEQVFLAKEEQETVVNNAIRETEEQKETIDRQSSSVEDDLRTSQAEFSTVISEWHEELKEEEQQNGNLRTDFTEIEKRLREELTRTEIRVALLSKLLTTKHQQVENFQRQLKKMKQQLTVKEERKENFRTQLEKEQRLRVELTEKETIETRLREQLKEKDHQEANFSRRLTELEQQLAEKEEQDETLRKQVTETEQRLREEITEKDARETELREQIAEKDQKLREMKQQLTKKEEREDNLQTQRRQMEQQLTEKDERVENLRTNLRETEERLTQKEEQEESLRINLRQTEQRMREELTEKETKETELREQLRERDHQVFNFQRRTREMEQQFTEKEEQEENLRTQLRETERRLREETTEKEARENELSEQLRKRDQQLREMEQQLAEKEKREETLRTQLRIHAMEQRLREEMTEETRETGLREQLRERDQQVANFEGRMREMERQLTEKEERKENLQTQLREMAQRLTERETRETGLLEHLRERDQQVANFEGRMREMQQQFRAENANLQQQVAELEDRVGSESNDHDWVISRDEIQMTDKSLGVGGWGEVFEGRYCGCAVAVKRIHEAIISPHNQGLFQREIDIASRCRHPCLLQFIGATNDEEMPLFVTELMESNLRQLLEERQRRRRLSKTEITVISLDVARALNYLHQKKPDPIIHRDVSSANVLLWRQGDRWRGKVSDYGTAKFEEQCMSIVPGCFAYSAPEVQKASDQTVKVRIYVKQLH